MFKKIDESSGNVIGFKVIGTLTKADYEQMVPEIEALVGQEGHIRMLLDMEEFKWEKVEAWGADMKFGRDYREKIDKIAMVGDKKWQEWLTKLVEPFYAKDAKFFHTADETDAWAWLHS